MLLKKEHSDKAMNNLQNTYLTKIKTVIKKHLFPILIIHLFIFVTVITLFSLNRIDFDNISDRAAAKNFIFSDDNYIFQDLAKRRVAECISDFEDEDSVINSMLYALFPTQLSFSKADEYTSKSPVYTVYSDNNCFFSVTLSNKKNPLSLFDKWVISDVSISKDCQIGTVTYVEVPYGATVKVNEKEIDNTYLISEKSKYFALTEFEENLSDKYCSKIYCIGTIFDFSNLKITASLNGTELNIAERSNGSVKFAYPFDYTSIYSFTVPSGASIKINGINLTDKYIVDDEIEYPLLSRFEKNIENSKKAVTYSINGLFSEPEISVYYEGVFLEKYGTQNVYRIPDEMTFSYKIFAPQKSTVRVNGILLGSTEITNNNVNYPLLNEASEYIKNIEHMTEYTVSGLLSEPTVSAYNSDGIHLSINKIYSSEHSYFFTSSNSSVPEKDRDFLDKFSKGYIRYISEGSKDIATNYYYVGNMTVLNSPAFTKIKSIYKALYSTEAKTNINFGKIVFNEYTKYSENSFSCIIDVPYSYSLGENIFNEKIRLEILYVYYGNSTKVIKFNLY